MRRGDVTVIITNLHQGNISVGLLSRLLRQAGVSCEQWLGELNFKGILNCAICTLSCYQEY